MQIQKLMNDLRENLQGNKPLNEDTRRLLKNIIKAKPSKHYHS